MHTQLRDSFEKAAPQPTSEPDYEALWRWGRRMRRTRFSVSMAAVASITALVAVSVQTGMFSGLLSRERVNVATGDLPSAPSGEKLFIAGIDAGADRGSSLVISFTDLATGETSPTGITDFSPGDALSPLTVSGESLVYLADGVYSTPTDLSRSPEKIGSAAYFSPAFVDGRVWLALFDGSLPDSGWLGRLQEVSADDGTLITDVTLPRAQWRSLVGEVSSGLVFEDGPAITVWDFFEREVVLKIEHALPLSLQGDLIAWCDTTNCHEELTVLNVATGEESTVSPPDGHSFTAESGSAFSPDGRYLTTTVNTQGGDRRFALVHVATGATEVIPELGRGGLVAWSSSSDKVYLVTIEERLFSYQPETKRIDLVSSGLPLQALDIVVGGL